MQGPHTFIDATEDERASITGDDAVHLLRVLRVRPGDAVSVSDGRGTVWQGAVEEAGDGLVRIRLGERQGVASGSPRITVVHALPKQRKLDDVIQRLVELGVDEIRPVHSIRSQVELAGPRAAKAVTRWRAVAYAAAKQSRRAWLPTIADIGDWNGAPIGTATCGVTCWEESEVPLRSVLDTWGDCDDVVVCIGPEGGLTAGEVEAAGLPHATLGTTVLRTDTAALVAVAAIRYHLGLMSR